ncbi:MAG: tRNA (adenosine(37)-N6)-threonylcarbamoyltransferase complex transferase subunit TsaD [Candidatus Babeliales bacterium]|jgi:N6-L-threonylcarbamoyladenine synthase
MLILGIDTSCDETGAAVFDTAAHKLLSHALFSQIDLHEVYGGVVPEIASRSQLEKIDIIVAHALAKAGISIEHIDGIAVTNRPGLVGSLLVGLSFAKGIAWALRKKIMGVDHLEGHIFSSFLQSDGGVRNGIEFPMLALSASGGHTALHRVKDFGNYELIGQTHDDAAGEAFDKIAKMLGLGYPGGAVIEKLAAQVNFHDFFSYPRTKFSKERLEFSFSGLKTAVLYDLAKKGAYDLATGPIKTALTPALQQQVASSLLVCVGDIFCASVREALIRQPDIQTVTFAGGVACNKYLRSRLEAFCMQAKRKFFAAPPSFCTDNGAMIAFVGDYKSQQNKWDTLALDVIKL